MLLFKLEFYLSLFFNCVDVGVETSWIRFEKKKTKGFDPDFSEMIL